MEERSAVPVAVVDGLHRRLNNHFQELRPSVAAPVDRRTCILDRHNL